MYKTGVALTRCSKVLKIKLLFLKGLLIIKFTLTITDFITFKYAKATRVLYIP